uniref:Uncharacterized protein n=1 Tax=Rhizophora mucronata TaxID=61149 RepID=A0A2P2PJD1_RHIMU
MSISSFSSTYATRRDGYLVIKSSMSFAWGSPAIFCE